MKKLLITLILLTAISNIKAEKRTSFQDATSEPTANTERTLTIQLPEIRLPDFELENRDPFISAAVIDPYVTTDSRPKKEQKRASDELIKYINNSLTKAIKASVDIRGLSSGNKGGNYALINGLLQKEGDTIEITITGNGLVALQQATLLAQQQGFQLQLGTHVPLPPTSIEGEDANNLPEPPSATTIKVILQRIENRNLIFKFEPTNENLEIPFERDLSPKAKGEGTTTPEGPNSLPPQGKPPKI